MVKKFTIPFASQGDANDIPDALQVDGKVSFTQGFGYDYERPYDDPQAKDIAREDMNGLFKAITSAVGELQTLGASEWSNAISYPKGAIVYFEKDLYISQIDDNQNTPPQSWVSITSIANDSLKKAANLSDLTNKATARSNLGLGNSATLNKTDVLGTSTSLVATQKLVNDTKINLDNSIASAQNTANQAINKANVLESTKRSLSDNVFDQNGIHIRRDANINNNGSILRADNEVDGYATVLVHVTNKEMTGYHQFDKFETGVVATREFVESKSIGINQKWVDVTSQRVADTTYTNNTGKPIYISVSMGGGEGNAIIYIDGVAVSSVDRAGSASTSVYAIIPIGSEYRATTTRSLSKWFELR